MPRPRPAVLAPLILLGAAQAAFPLHAQHAGHDPMAAMHGDSMPALHVMAQVVPVVTRATAAPGGGARTEVALTQTVLMAQGAWWNGRARLDATLDAEGVTMPGGELSLGAFGEGFADRRHPHTYLHELMLTGLATSGSVRLSVSAGRGFAPFGTDDPMVRPFAKYPINHHLAQILERGIVLGAARLGVVTLEGATFTGEEPQRPSSLPLMRRFGDSWSTRATVAPTRRSEIQASYARVSSPEMPAGFGLDQRKTSVSVRAESHDAARHAMAEWARTAERDPARGADAFAYEAALAEGAVRVGTFGLAVRLEQTDRPEEERLGDPFRTARPATDLHISGITRWRSVTAAVSAPMVTHGMVAGVPFVEVSHLAAASRDEHTLFDPQAFYGGTRFWMVTAGIRLRAGESHARMGRYGVALQ